MGPFDVVDAGRTAVLTDPSDATFRVWQPKAARGAQLVNEPGAWSMSALNTPDPERASAFYGAVFGWQTDTFDLDGTAIALFRLPGFVGGEPQQPVPRDLVATMAPLAGDDIPPHWGVDFWVDDADATADHAVRLGGQVVAPPYDILGADLRQAVLADPEGATFSVTKVVIPG